MSRPDARAVLVFALLVVVGIAVVLVGPLQGIALVAGSALVLAIPGYGLVRTIVPGAGLGRLDVILASVGSSIALTILIGVVLSIVGVPLGTGTWLASLLGLSAILGVVAWLRRASQAPSSGSGIGAGLRRGGAPIRSFVPSSLGSVRPVEVGLVALAVLLTATALGVARLGAIEQPAAAFTQLWLIPRDGGAVEVGLRSEESAVERYRVVLEASSGILEQWSLDVVPGSTWDHVVQLPAGARTGLKALLFLADVPGQPYRSVSLSPSSAPPLTSPSPGASP